MNDNVITLIIITILLILFITISSPNTIKEHYRDNIPGNFRWNIFRCLGTNCVIDNYSKCLDWCDHNYKQLKLGCHQSCLAYAQDTNNLLSNDKNYWGEMTPLFYRYSLLNT